MSRHGLPLAVLGTSIALCACGGAGYRTEGAAERLPETCSGPEEISACQQRLEQYQGRLDAMTERLGASASQSVPPAEGGLTPAAPGEPGTPLGYGPGQPPAEPAPDCDDARDLRDRICELSEAICELADRPEATEQTKASCTSSRESCERGRRRVAARCPT